MVNYTNAAVAATETLIKNAVTRFPLDPLPILESMSNVMVMSFADLSDSAGISRRELMPLFGKSLDAVTSFSNGAYIVAYNSILPFSMIQRALARELGHIVLGHKGYSEDNIAEAMGYAYHLLCPRPLIHSMKATCLRVTTDLVANITGMFDQSIVAMRRIPGTDVPVNLNRFIRNQITPFVTNIFEFCQTTFMNDGSAVADFGSFMDGYKE